MPILVKHSGNPGVVATVAAASGRDARQQQDAAVQLEIIERNRQRAHAANLQRSSQDFAAKQADLSRRHSDAESAIARAFAGSQAADARAFSGEQADKNRDFSSEQADKSRDFSITQSELARLGPDVSFEYSDAQRNEFNQLSDTYEQAVSSGEYTQDELNSLRTEVDAKRRAITMQPRFKKRSAFPDGQGTGQTWESTDGRFLLTRDSKGEVKKIAETNNKPTYKDEMDAWENAIALATGKDGTVDAKKARQLKEMMLPSGDAEGAPQAAANSEQLDALADQLRTMAVDAAKGQSPKLAKQLRTMAQSIAGGVPAADGGELFAPPAAPAAAKKDDPGHKTVVSNGVTVRLPVPPPPPRQLIPPDYEGDARRAAEAKKKNAFESPKFSTKSDFIKAFTASMGRAPTWREEEVALAKGYFKDTKK